MQPETRYAIVRNARTRREAEAYLPDNYKVVWEGLVYRYPGEWNVNGPRDVLGFVIEGRDDHGWSMDKYVIPRYASGLIWAEEIDLSHPLIKEVPL